MNIVARNENEYRINIIYKVVIHVSTTCTIEGNMNLDHQIYIVTAPSGTGKTTLNRKLVSEFDHLEISISHTTRAKRPKEAHGDHYWFISKDTFMQKVNAGLMLEWAEVFGNMYGTSIEEIDRIANEGKQAILEIDVQGWEKIKHKLPKAQAIFILPPSVKSLYERLYKRGTETEETILKRLRAARSELEHSKNYDYFVVNDKLSRAFEDLKNIILGNPITLSKEAGLAHCNNLIHEFSDSWLRK